jgi:WXG100 family type VII secretion target
MADTTNIDDATLYQAANDCRSAIELINGEASKVRNAKDTVAAQWRGAASNTFQAVMVRWDEEASKLMQAVNDASDLLDKTGKTARANEEEQDSMFSKFQGMING